MSPEYSRGIERTKNFIRHPFKRWQLTPRKDRHTRETKQISKDRKTARFESPDKRSVLMARDDLKLASQDVVIDLTSESSLIDLTTAPDQAHELPLEPAGGSLFSEMSPEELSQLRNGEFPHELDRIVGPNYFGYHEKRSE